VTDKDLAAAYLGAAMAKVFREAGSDRICQRKEKWRRGLSLLNAQPTLAPFDILECHGDNFARPEAVFRDELKDRVVSLAKGRRTVDRFKKTTDDWPRKRTGKLFSTVESRRVNLGIQANGGLTASDKISQQRAKVSHHVLDSLAR
jgi:hypothetical protein